MTHSPDNPDHADHADQADHDNGAPTHHEPMVHHSADLSSGPPHLEFGSAIDEHSLGEHSLGEHSLGEHSLVSHSVHESGHLGTVYGHPEESKQDWFFQGNNNQCGPSAVTQVLAHLTGHVPTNQSEVLQYAELKGYYDPITDQGMNAAQISDSLAHFGVPNHIVQGQDMANLENYLSSGHSVLVTVDAPKIWTDQEDPGNTADHVVELTGIDTSTNTVYLSDTGNPDLSVSHVETVPLDVFNQAWATANSDVNAANPTGDGNHLAIVTDATYHGIEATVPGDPLQVATPSSGGSATAGSTDGFSVESILAEGATIILPLALAGAGLWGLSRWPSS